MEGFFTGGLSVAFSPCFGYNVTKIPDSTPSVKTIPEKIYPGVYLGIDMRHN